MRLMQNIRLLQGSKIGQTGIQVLNFQKFQARQLVMQTGTLVLLLIGQGRDQRESGLDMHREVGT